MKKKGFTLVELLAVIVILAVIAVIAVPIIIGIVKDAKYKAAVESLKGYLDAAEKAITLNELKQEANFPEADNNGCYNLKDLDKKIEAKGNRPTGIKDSDKMCFKDGNVKDMDKVIIDGYEAEVVDYEIKVGGKVVTNESSSSTTPEPPAISYTGIPSKEYSVGEKVSYLGYNWYVIKDNGDNTKIIRETVLTSNELKANLPSGVSNSIVGNNGQMPMCLTDDNEKFCVYNYNKEDDYSWGKSVVKPTIENWISNKMQENNLEISNELKSIAFNDGSNNYNSYIKIPNYDETIYIKNTVNTPVYNDQFVTSCSYSLLPDEYLIAALDIGNHKFYTVFPTDRNSGSYCFNNPPLRWLTDPSSIIPIIIVNEK